MTYVLPDEHRRFAEAARGFMPPPEGEALFEAAAAYAAVGPIVEIGTYCGKSTIYLAAAAAQTGQVVVTSTTTVARRRTSRAGSTTNPTWSTRPSGCSTPCRRSGRRSPRPVSSST